MMRQWPSTSKPCAATPSRAACSRRPRCRSAIDRLGFVQADPIRAPARAQDLTLRHRVAGLPRRRPRAPLPEARRSRRTSSSTTASCRARTQALMHPRTPRTRVAEGALGAGARGARLRARARRGAPARGRRALRARQGAATGSAARATRARSCSTPCTTAACCASRGATAACACTRRASRSPPAAAPARARSTRWSTWSCASTRRCRRARSASWSAACATARRSGRRARSARWRARSSGSPTRRVDGVDWYWPAGENPASRRHAPDDACACSRRSTRWCGTAAASSSSGAGPTASRPTRRRRSASAATTRCRCCGATG